MEGSELSKTISIKTLNKILQAFIFSSMINYITNL